METASWTDPMPQCLERAIRFRNYAEELRIIAADKTVVENQEALLKAASDYEQWAEKLEAISTAKKAQGLPL